MLPGAVKNCRSASLLSRKPGLLVVVLVEENREGGGEKGKSRVGERETASV